MPHHHTAEILWERGDQAFTDRRYSRAHVLRFDGGVEVAGSASPQVVPLPMSLEAAVDPEEMFIAALSSCHMLWFLSVAASRGYRVDRYHDVPTGLLRENTEGKLVMATVTLRPEIAFSGEALPDADMLHDLHRLAHEECFLANSVKTQIDCAPVLEVEGA